MDFIIPVPGLVFIEDLQTHKMWRLSNAIGLSRVVETLRLHHSFMHNMLSVMRQPMNFNSQRYAFELHGQIPPPKNKDIFFIIFFLLSVPFFCFYTEAVSVQWKEFSFSPS